ncbi:MAG: Mrp/NBP35 family ATP-binding protein [Candidatus Sericytochromatia bacterium]|nr:Mrp/NBP35 family ATP-binding protein [Candidatus Sericytochromatia bacterium]
MPTVEDILALLRDIEVPDLGHDLVSLGMVQDLKIMHGIVTFTVTIKPGATALQGRLDAPLKQAVRAIEGVNDVAIHWLVTPEKPATSARPAGKGAPPGGPAALPPGVKTVIAVGSGKGGVGKSTVTVNLALALAATGARVGVLDADIYGPSVPYLLGVPEQKPTVRNDKLVPIEAFGLKVMSMGFLLPDPDEPVVWRGPMLAGAMRQFFQDVDWGELDHLVVDLPPGTGDVPLSLVQLVPVNGAVIVLTPQPIAAAIGTKTLRMLEAAHTPILGVVENMSHFVCEHCGSETDIFTRGGGRTVAEHAGVALLGEIPLDPVIRASGDAGCPVVVAAPTSPQAVAFHQLARAVQERLLATAASATRP